VTRRLGTYDNKIKVPFFKVGPCINKALDLMPFRMRLVQSVFGGFGGRSLTETCDSSWEPIFNMLLKILFLRNAPGANDRRVMRGGANFIKKTDRSKIVIHVVTIRSSC
jgi:hypothetical protein